MILFGCGDSFSAAEGAANVFLNLCGFTVQIVPTMNLIYGSICGSIYGAAVGDAMGAATETRSAEMIREHFGGWVDDLLLPPNDCFAHGCPAGSVTDDFSLAYFIALELIACKGQMNEAAAKRAVLS